MQWTVYLHVRMIYIALEIANLPNGSPSLGKRVAMVALTIRAKKQTVTIVFSSLLTTSESNSARYSYTPVSRGHKFWKNGNDI